MVPVSVPPCTCVYMYMCVYIHDTSFITVYNITVHWSRTARDNITKIHYITQWFSTRSQWSSSSSLVNSRLQLVWTSHCVTARNSLCNCLVIYIICGCQWNQLPKEIINLIIISGWKLYCLTHHSIFLNFKANKSPTSGESLYTGWVPLPLQNNMDTHWRTCWWCGIAKACSHCSPAGKTKTVIHWSMSGTWYSCVQASKCDSHTISRHVGSTARSLCLQNAQCSV